MHHELTAVIERDGDWFIAFCPEVQGANGQGRSREESLTSLSDAMQLFSGTDAKTVYSEVSETVEQLLVLTEAISRR